jgi:uroporphyrin-III C-methyltransferase
MTLSAAKPLFGPLALWLQTQVQNARDAVRPALPQILRGKARLGFVSLVGAGPGSADLITLRGLQRLQAADVIFYDRLADPALLAHVRKGAEAVYVGKAPGRHSMPQAQISALLVQAAQAGKRVVRLKCGDPGIFARGAEEAAALTEAGIEWEIVPGVTSACAAAASARSFLTERGQTEFLVLATGHSRADGQHDWQGMARPGTTLACYMGVAQSASVSRGLQQAGWPADCSVEVVSKAQTPEEKIHSCQLDGLSALCAAHEDLSPAMLLIRWPLTQKATTRQRQAQGAGQLASSAP